jgi:NTP pyrophosphatase (non-canonical NTP hydrolase)
MSPFPLASTPEEVEMSTKAWAAVYDRDLDHDQFLTWLQKQHQAWEDVNFPESTQNTFHSFVGVTEEVGELAHALLKADQHIRGSEEEHDAAGQDAVGDIFIYMAGLCNKRGWNMQKCIEKAWLEVAARDWTKNKDDGKVDVLTDDDHNGNGDQW